MENPLQIIAKKSLEMRSIAELLRGTSMTSVSNDIPDVFETAASILQTVIQTQTEAGLIDNLKHDIEAIDVMLAQRESKFRQQMDLLVEKVTKNLEDAIGKFHDDNDSIEKITKKAHQKNQTRLNQNEELHNKKVEEMLQKHKENRRVLLDKEREARLSTESSVSKQMSDLSAQFQKKLSDLENETQEKQKQLQMLIHDKHQQNRKKAEDVEAEEMRVARVHEEISRDFQVRKKQAEEESQKCREEIIRIQNEINEESLNGQAKLKRMTKEYEDTKRAEMNDSTDELNQLKKETDAATQELSDLSGVLSEKKMQNAARMGELRQKRASQLEDAKKPKDGSFESQKADIVKMYEQKIEKLEAAIAKSDAERTALIDSMKQSAASEVKDGKMSLYNLKEEHENEINSLKEELNKRKGELRELKQDRDNDFANLSNVRQNEFGKIVGSFEDNDRERAKKVQEIMKQFEEQQQRLSELRVMSIEQRNKVRAEEIAQLKERQEQRRKEMLERIESKMKEEVEEKYRQKEQEGSQQRKNEIVNLEAKVTDMRDRMNVLELKLTGLCQTQKERIEEFFGMTDKTLIDDIKKLETSEDFNEREDIKKRILQEASNINKRKGVVLAEANEIDRSIKSVTETFNRKIAQMEHQFIASSNHITSKTRQSEQTKARLTQQIQLQNPRIEKLAELAAKKEEEVKEFAESFAKKTEQYRKEAVDEFETEIVTIQQKPTGFEREMSDLKADFKLQMEAIQAQLESAKVSTSEITQRLQQEREYLLEEAQVKVQEEFKVCLQITKEQHQQRLERMDQEFEEAKLNAQKEQEELQKSLQVTLSEEAAAFKQQIRELMQRKELISRQIETIEDELFAKNNQECPGCMQRKVIINRLLSKREQLQSRAVVMKGNAAELDVLVDGIFHPDTQHSNLLTANRRQGAQTALQRARRVPLSRIV